MSKESANVPRSNLVLWSLVVGAWGLLAAQWLLPDARATARTAAAPQAFGRSASSGSTWSMATAARGW